MSWNSASNNQRGRTLPIHRHHQHPSILKDNSSTLSSSLFMLNSSFWCDSAVHVTGFAHKIRWLAGCLALLSPFPPLTLVLQLVAPLLFASSDSHANSVSPVAAVSCCGYTSLNLTSKYGIMRNLTSKYGIICNLTSKYGIMRNLTSKYGIMRNLTCEIAEIIG